MPLTPGLSRPRSDSGSGRRISGRRRPKWHYVVAALLLAGGATDAFLALSPSTATGLGPSSAMSSAPGRGKLSGGAPVPMMTSTATMAPSKPAAGPRPAASGPYQGGAVPRAGADYAGSLVLNDTGAQLATWNKTSTFCSEQSWEVPNGRVTTDASGDVNLSVTGQPGSCVALTSPQAFSSGVIEAEIDFPAMPGNPDTIADWSSFWMTNQAAWPTHGELDAAEVEPVDGVNDVTWHSGSAKDEFTASTDFSATKLPENAPNLTPGWHTVDVVYTKGFFAVYYDGQEFTSYTSSHITGDPLNVFFTTSVAANDSTVRGELGGPPVNSDSSPTTYTVKYVKVWSFK